MWGSDWPVVDLAGGYARWRGATEALIGRLSQEDRDAILGGNAVKFYQLSIPNVWRDSAK
jgi:L-fuconolactonase